MFVIHELKRMAFQVEIKAEQRKLIHLLFFYNRGAMSAFVPSTGRIQLFKKEEQENSFVI